MIYETKSAAQTKKIAALFAKKIIATKPGKGAFVIALKGDLGAGKTTFMQGFMKALGTRGKVMSPTFTLLRSYRIKAERFKDVHHFDCYRINNVEEMKELKFKELLKNPENIIVVEWPERIATLLPRSRIIVSLGYGNTLNERTITVT